MALAEALKVCAVFVSHMKRINWPGAEDNSFGCCETHPFFSLQTNSSLKVLDLTNNRVGVQGASSLGGMLPLNTTLETLRFGLNLIENGGVEALLEGIKSNTTLKVNCIPSGVPLSANRPASPPTSGPSSFFSLASIHCSR